jgi:hypothetical protein
MLEDEPAFRKGTIAPNFALSVCQMISELIR